MEASRTAKDEPLVGGATTYDEARDNVVRRTLSMQARMLMATALVIISACGGSVREDAPPPAEASVDAGAPAVDEGGASSEADAGSGDLARDAGDAPSSQGRPDPEPERTNVYVPVGAPVPYDAEALPGGSFEGPQGYGFDLCYTRTRW